MIKLQIIYKFIRPFIHNIERGIIYKENNIPINMYIDYSSSYKREHLPKGIEFKDKYIKGYITLDGKIVYSIFSKHINNNIKLNLINFVKKYYVILDKLSDGIICLDDEFIKFRDSLYE